MGLDEATYWAVAGAPQRTREPEYRLNGYVVQWSVLE